VLKFGVVAISAALISAAVFAQELPGDPKAGRAFVVANCRQCHEVGNGGRLLSPPKRGPAFRDVANTAATSPLSLRIFLTTNHPTMPNLILSKKELDDVISYILSLRKPAPTRS